MAETTGTTGGPEPLSLSRKQRVPGTTSSAVPMQDRHIWAAVQPFVDARLDVMAAKIDARVAAAEQKAETELSQALGKLDGLPKFWPLVATIVLTVAGGIGAVFGILGYASDRFDSGVNSMGAVEEAIDAGREIDAAQDARLDRILRALEQISGDASDDQNR